MASESPMVRRRVRSQVLKQRVITAVIMAAVFLAAIAWLPLVGLALLFGLLVAMGAWEWSSLAGLNNSVMRFAYVLLICLLMGGAYAYYRIGGESRPEQLQSLFGLACLWWSVALLWVKGYPGSALFWRSMPMRIVLGVLILVPAWLASVYLLSFPRGGLLMVILVMVVAAADIGAYFAGRRFGRHKLAEHVSPKKTWEGFWGGVAACAMLAVLLWTLMPGRADHIGLGAVLSIIVICGLASVVGDLTVSMVKRESGVKDTGSLLPGHGGVLDRLDSLSAAAPVFALGLLLVGW